MEEAYRSRLHNMLTKVIIIKLGYIRCRNKFNNLECILLYMNLCYLKKLANQILEEWKAYCINDAMKIWLIIKINKKSSVLFCFRLS